MWAKDSQLGLLHRLQSPQGCPCPSTGPPRPTVLLEGPRLAWSTSTQERISRHVPHNVPFHVTPPFCFSKCISSHFSSSGPFLCVLLCLHSRVLFVCPHKHPHLSPLVLPLVSPPPGSPVPNSYYCHSDMSEQRHHAILRQVKVLTSDRPPPSVAEPCEASCD